MPSHLFVYCVLPWKLVVPPFDYVEKGDKNDAAISCSVSPTLFFLLRQIGNKILWQNFHEILYILRYKISWNKHKKYEMNDFAKFRKILFRKISSTSLV
jgi:hypothetical protein